MVRLVMSKIEDVQDWIEDYKDGRSSDGIPIQWGGLQRPRNTASGPLRRL